MCAVKFEKGDTTFVVTEKDYEEYEDYLRCNVDDTRILSILNNDIEEYEVVMGIYAEHNQ